MNKKIIIFDLDGTLADIRHRRHFVEKPSNGKYGWSSSDYFCFDPGIPHAPVYYETVEEFNAGRRDFIEKGAEKFYADRKAAEWKPDWDSFHKACVDDTVNENIQDIFLAMKDFYRVERYVDRMSVEIWSGRSDSVRVETIVWLTQNGLHPDELRMRPHGDHCPDTELKKRWLDEVGKENVLMVFDDRDRLVEMWRDEGITCLQVAEGNF